MTPVRNLLAIGLVGLGLGCSTLKQGSMFRPLSERTAAPPVKPAETSVDIFKPEVESPVARISHYFPSLPKMDTSPDSASPSTGWYKRASRTDNHFKAIPRPDARVDDQTATASMPGSSGGRPRAMKRPVNEASRERDDRVAPASQTAPDPIPILPVTVVAETDPNVGRSPMTILPPLTPAEQALRAARISQAGGSVRSVRRMPPVPRHNPPQVAEPIVAARELDEPGMAKVALDEDREMRLVKAKVDETPTAETKPEASPERSLSPPPSTDDAEAKKVEEPKPSAEVKVEEPKPSAEVKAEEPKPSAEVEPKPTQTPTLEADLPPKMDSPQASDDPAPTRNVREVAAPPRHGMSEPDNLRMAVKTNRPRMERYAPVRSDRVADLPPPLFPNSYYDAGVTATPSARAGKLDGETNQARWTWTPKIIRRLRGEDVTWSSPSLTRESR